MNKRVGHHAKMIKYLMKLGKDGKLTDKEISKLLGLIINYAKF